MLPQPLLRFLLADEPGTGKTIMAGATWPSNGAPTAHAPCRRLGTNGTCPSCDETITVGYAGHCIRSRQPTASRMTGAGFSTESPGACALTAGIVVALAGKDHVLCPSG